MSAEIPTPRTDPFVTGFSYKVVPVEFAQTLERELIALESAARLAREALSFYAEEGNWRREGSLDGNSSNFDGWTPAKQALSALNKVLK